MEKFEVNILGCGSALPTTRHLPTSQVVNVRDKLFMIDCGEGTQLQIRKSKLRFSRLNHIFISHLHGDHCFGLMGLISSLGLLGRTAKLHIYSPLGLEALLKPQLKFFCNKLPYDVVFHSFNTIQPEVIYEDRSLTVTTIPLEHRMPSCGFLFAEKQRPNHLIKDMIDFYKIPIAQLHSIKLGADFLTGDGQVIPNNRLTLPAIPARKYAYCSDTIYKEGIVDQVRGVDLLFHEATFLESEKARAKETFHTTAMEAAIIARDAEVKKLIIGHFSARYESDELFLTEAKTIFPNTMLAHEGLCVTIE